ncbi:MAG: DNA polymerase Y family protein, partial [Chromatiales bacterium]|nr:DNA polymerase Y family protein [Chromatiales bacterium]
MNKWTTSYPQRLWAAVYLTDFSLEALTRGAVGTGPIAVAEGVGSKPRIAECNVDAADCGVEAGMPVAAAIAIAHDLQVLQRQVQVEQTALEGLAGWAGQFSSMVCLIPEVSEAPQASAIPDKPYGLLIEIGGSLGLFGDALGLCGRLRQELRALGFSAEVAAAPTPTAAWWLAKSLRNDVITDLRDIRRAVISLSVHCLSLEPTRLAGLNGIGVETIGQCVALPRAESARRFGARLWVEIDRALGKASDPRSTYQAPENLTRRLLLPAPVINVEALVFALGRLLREMMGALCATGQAIQALTLSLTYSGGGSTSIQVELIAPSRDTKHVLGLFRHRLEQLTLDGAVEQMDVAIVQSVGLAPRNLDLFNNHELGGDEWLATLERLHARLGIQCVSALTIEPDHRPEFAWGEVSPSEASTAQIPLTGTYRPFWLLPEPTRLELHNGCPIYRGALTLLTCAERIEGGWWQDKDIRRDYHVAVNVAG